MSEPNRLENSALAGIDHSVKSTIACSPYRLNVDALDREWVNQVAIDSAVYALPLPMIRALRSDLRFWKFAGLFDQETEFSSACRARRVVGVYGEATIVFPYLAGTIQPLDEKSMSDLGWSPHQREASRLAERKETEVRDRLKGYLGWLLTEPAFLVERDKLRNDWHHLAADEKPGFPLRRTPQFRQHLPGSVPASGLTSAFASSFDAFLRKWGLGGLATWELPEPNGPHFPNPLPGGSSASESEEVHIVLPPHYPLQGGDVLLNEIRQQQRYLAEERNIADPVASMSHFGAYGQMFEVGFWENVLRHRFERLRVKGFISIVERAIADHLGRELSQIQKHRKAITACRGGRRHKVRWLRVK